MNKKVSGLAMTTAVCMATVMSGCEAPSLDFLSGKKEQVSQPASSGDNTGAQTPAEEPATGAPQGQDQGSNAPHKPIMEETIRTVDGIPTVTNPEELYVIVNKQRALPSDYVPSDLTEPNVPFPFKDKVEKRLLREPAARALEALFSQAKQDGIELYAVSGYRSYKTQKSLYETYVRTQGEAHAAAFSAVPGKSEHQTGLAMDVSGLDQATRLEQTFADTPEGMWLAEKCAAFGFIIRYPKGKEDITGYAYEPWHLRYVGKEMAEEIMSRGITLEEYFQESRSS